MIKKRIRTVLNFLSYILPVYLLTFSGTAVVTTVSAKVSEYRESEEVKVTPDKIEISGNSRVSRETLLIQADLDRDISYFDIDTEEIKFYISSNGWVEKCFVKKIFPDRIKILIKEYEPVIIVSRLTETSQGYTVDPWFADKRGYLFKKTHHREIDITYPVYYAGAVDKVPEKHIRTAVSLAESWKRFEKAHGHLCLLSSIRFSSSEGFRLSCEFPDGRIAEVSAGYFSEGGESVNDFTSRFFTTANKLDKKGLWAGNYIFEQNSQGRIIVDNLSKKN